MAPIVSYNIYLPSNALAFYEFIIEVSEFELLPIDKLYEVSFFRLIDNLEL